MSRSRRGFWSFLLVGLFLFLLLYRLHPTHEDVVSPLESLLLPEESNILHPGDFVDPTGYPDTYIAPAQDQPMYEPDVEGTLHDIPYVIIFAFSLTSNRLLGRTASTAEEPFP